MTTDEHEACKSSFEDAIIADAEYRLCCCKCPRTAQWQDASNGKSWTFAKKWCYEHVLEWRDWGGVVPCVDWEMAVRL